MTHQEETRRRFDTHLLLGSAGHLLRELAENPGDAILSRMAREWADAYARYSAGESARIPWSVNPYDTEEPLKPMTFFGRPASVLDAD